MTQPCVWVGRIVAEKEAVYERFIGWLAGLSGTRPFAHYRSMGETLQQVGDRLSITMATDERTTNVIVLRNHAP